MAIDLAESNLTCATHLSMLSHHKTICLSRLTGSCTPGDREGLEGGKTVSFSHLYRRRLFQTGCQGESLRLVKLKKNTKKTNFNLTKNLFYRSWSMHMSTTWPHCAQSHLTKKHMCARSPTALIMMSLPWTRTAGQKTA